MFPRVVCHEWKIEAGQEGSCDVETQTTTWQVSYTREGKENKKRTGTVTNLLVVFHPSASSHRVHEWWDQLVGPGKALDTNKWTILSVGTPGDLNPKAGSPMLLSIEEILVVQEGVIDQLYPGAHFVAGGPARGGHVAALLALRFPDKVKKLFLGNVIAKPVVNEKPAVQYLTTLQQEEMRRGPYDNWVEDQKRAWWNIASKLYVDVSYTDAYFLNAKFMTEQGAKPEDYKGAEDFRRVATKAWTEYFVKYSSPHWYGAQESVVDNALDDLKPEDLARLPKDILLLWNKLDIGTPFPLAEEFVGELKRQKKDVRMALVEDAHGHLSLLSPGIAPSIETALKKFVED